LLAVASLTGDGVFRFVAGFFHEPDARVGILTLGMSMGQWLWVPMVLGGGVVGAAPNQRVGVTARHLSLRCFVNDDKTRFFAFAQLRCFEVMRRSIMLIDAVHVARVA
jgi:hypothetical protein